MVSTEFAGHRIIGVGNTLHWSKNWTTFADFLSDYLKKTMGEDWGTAELAKPESDQHPLLRWYRSLCSLQAQAKESSTPDEDGVFTTALDGPSRAYYLLAYDLYVLRHHSSLQESLLRRIRHPDQFQGARYELFVAATMIRAGFTLEYEDESDPSKKHPEFLATHVESGQTIAVEAKSRHRPGVLGRPQDSDVPKSFSVGIGRLLRGALDKNPGGPYLIFIDANMPPEIASPLSPVDWRSEVDQTTASIEPGTTEAGLILGIPFNMLVVTNTPDHYGDEGEAAPGYLFCQMRPHRPTHDLPHPRILDAIEKALEQATNIPQYSRDDE